MPAAHPAPPRRLPAGEPAESWSYVVDDGVPRSSGGWRHPSRLTVATAAAGLVALLAAGGTVVSQLVHRADDRGTVVTLSAPPSDSGSASATGKATTGSFAAVACNGPAPVTAPTAPQRNAARGVNGWALMSGWSYFTDGTGFHMPVPDGWSYQKIGTMYCFRDPLGERVLSLDVGRNPAGDPVKACRTEAARLVDAGALPHYQLITLELRPLLHKAADWEYRYAGTDGVMLHTQTRWFATNGKAYAISWATREIDWIGDLPKVNMVLSTFYAEGTR
jgi:hypothetical protein